MNPPEEAFDRVVSRVVDRVDDADDWCLLDGVAVERPECWHDVLAALRDDAALRHALRPARSTVQRVPLPAGRIRASRSIASWMGWAAALLIAAAWLLTAVHGAQATRPVPPRDLGTAPSADAHVVGELDRVLVDARPADAGDGFDVVYLRRVLERARVPALYQLASDEHGRPAPAAVTAAELAPAIDY